MKIFKSLNNKNTGITLIALVVTIIVLLILAGISISLLTGQDGIIHKASEAKKENEISTLKEIVNLEIIKEYDQENKSIYLNTDEVNEIMKDYTNNYKDKIGVYRDKLIYLGEKKQKKQCIWSKKDLKL